MDNNSDENAALESAARALEQGDAPQAALLCQTALVTFPSSGDIRILLAKALAKLGRLEQALCEFRTVLHKEPGNTEALNLSSTILRETGRLKEAVDCCLQAIQAAPGKADGFNNLGLCMLRQGRPREAAEHFAKASELSPTDARILHNLGVARQQLGMIVPAIEAYLQSLELAPQAYNTLMALARLLEMQGDDGAAEHLAKAIEVSPGSLEPYLKRAQILADFRRNDEAALVAHTAARLFPTSCDALNLLGATLREKGEFGEAASVLRKSIKLHPNQGAAYFLLSQCVPGALDQYSGGQLERLVEGSSLPRNERIYLAFALGNAHDQSGSYKAAMRLYDMANRIARQGHPPLDREAETAKVEWIIKYFSADRMRNLTSFGLVSELPVLIIGTMRSGTTLTEQILSSHPRIGGASEIPYWHVQCGRLYFSDEAHWAYRLAGLAKEYVRVLEKFCPGKQRVCDKSTQNHHTLGWIHSAIPSARIIHCRRNPLDTCLSMYTTLVRSEEHYLHDRGDIAFWYRLCSRLMDHWQEVLPRPSFLEICYEDLVSSQATVTRQMLGFLGMQWDDACLRPEANGRSIRTASAWQARQPVNTNSVERWRNYEPWLGDIKSLADGG